MRDLNKSARERMQQLLSEIAGDKQPAYTVTEEMVGSFAEVLEQLAVSTEELRRQNDELVEARDLIEQERQRYLELFEFAPDACILTDARGLIQEANQAAGELLKVESHQLAGKPLLVFFSEESLTQVSRIIRSGEAVRDFEIGIRPHHGKKGYVSITTVFVPASGSQGAQIRWNLRNITERNKALAALDASEQRFRTIFDQSTFGIVLLDLNGKIIRANPAFLDMLNADAGNLPDHFFALLDDGEEDVKAITAAFQAITRGKKPVPIQKTRLRTLDNCAVWAGITLSPMRNEQKRIRFVAAMVENITSEHQAEVELAEMRRRQLDSGEVERLRLAQELHDGPMQDLYGAVFHLSNLPGLEHNTDALEKIQGVQDILKHVAGTLRTICGELRPPTLANLGLERAILSHAEQLHELHPEIEFQLHLTSDGQALPTHIRMALFRIYQQCITNVLRHSRATSVVISFHVDEKEAALDIWDNGKGFTLPEKWVELLREGHYGLAGIAERVEALRGILKIDTRPGAGTFVHVTVPLSEQA